MIPSLWTRLTFPKAGRDTVLCAPIFDLPWPVWYILLSFVKIGDGDAAKSVVLEYVPPSLAYPDNYVSDSNTFYNTPFGDYSGLLLFVSNYDLF